MPERSRFRIEMVHCAAFRHLAFLIVNEIRQKRFSVVFGAAAFWLWDVFNETWNAMVYATTGQPVWARRRQAAARCKSLSGTISKYPLCSSFLVCSLANFSKRAKDTRDKAFSTPTRTGLTIRTICIIRRTRKSRNLRPKNTRRR